MVRPLKKEVIRRLEEIEAGLESSAERLKKSLEQEHKILSDENRISSELISDPFLKSVEEIKKDRVERSIQLLKDAGKDGLFGIKLRTNINEILVMNLAVSGVISREQDGMRIEEAINKQNIALQKEESMKDDEANRVLESMKTILSPDVQSQVKLKEYLDKGTEGLRGIHEALSSVEGINADKINAIGKIWSAFSGLRDGIKEQNGVCRRLISIIDKRKEALSADDLRKDLMQLSDLVLKEIEDSNNALRDYYKHIDLVNEDKEIRQLYWLAKKRIELSQDTILFMRQFSIKKMVFPSGNFATYSCSQKDAEERARSEKTG